MRRTLITLVVSAVALVAVFAANAATAAKTAKFEIALKGSNEGAPASNKGKVELTLENLSLGGVAVSGLAGGWPKGQRTQFALAPRGQSPILDVAGTVTWREGDAAGVAFDALRPGEEAIIYRALRRFLDIRT